MTTSIYFGHQAKEVFATFLYSFFFPYHTLNGIYYVICEGHT